jgi:hypothetical protein
VTLRSDAQAIAFSISSLIWWAALELTMSCADVIRPNVLPPVCLTPGL